MQCNMAAISCLWIAAYADGAWRDQMVTGSRPNFRHALRPEPSFRRRLNRWAGDASYDERVLSSLGGGHQSTDPFQQSLHHGATVLGLAQVSCTEDSQYEHHRRFLTNWSNDEQLQTTYYESPKGCPADCYSMRVLAMRQCATPQVLHHRAVRPRSIGNAALCAISLATPLFLGHWAGAADQVPLLAARQYRDFEAAFVEEAHHLPEPQLPTVPARDVLQSWQSKVSSETVPVLALPWPLVLGLFKGEVRHVVLRTHWHRQLLLKDVWKSAVAPGAALPRVIPDWPPAASAPWTTNYNVMWPLKSESFFKQKRVKDMGPEEAGNVVSQLRRSLPGASARGEFEQCVENIETLERLRWELDPLGEPPALDRRRHNTSAILDCIRMLRFANLSKLPDLIERCFRIALPKGLQGPVQKRRKLPSRSLLFRYEIGLDMALSILQQKSNTLAEKYRRWGLADSSPQARFDWLISQYREIKESLIPEVFEATVALERLITEHVRDTVEERVVHEAGTRRPPIKFHVEDSWKPLLATVGSSIREHVNQPMAVAYGHRGVSDKAAAQTLAWALLCPDGAETMQAHADSYVSQTGDMGTELSIPRLHVEKGCTSLLPAWMDREPMVTNLDIPNVAADADHAEEAPELAESLVGDGPMIHSDSECGNGPRLESPVDDVDGLMLESEGECDLLPEVVPSSSVDNVDGAMLESEGECDLPQELWPSSGEECRHNADTAGRVPSPPVPAPAPVLDPEPAPAPPGAGIMPAPAPAPRESTTYFLPNSLTVAGLQHIINNMNADTHKSLKHWEAFFAELKNLQGLFGMTERRQRYVFTCLRGTPYETNWSKSFENFSSSLYEPRWHEIIKFLKKAKPYMPILKATFCQNKCKLGVDGEGERMNEEKMQRSDRGESKFDPAALKATLDSPLHSLYTAMILLIEEQPEELTSWAEGCPCHGALLEGLNAEQRARCFQTHFGEGFTTCPCAGCKAPELAAGKLNLLLENIWKILEANLHESAAEQGIATTADAWVVVLQDFQAAKVHSFMLLQAKLDFWFRLPWRLCALALADEDDARSFVDVILAQFALDPIEEHHDPITWKWLKPDSPIRADLLFFRAGARRRELTMPTRTEIGSLKFVPVVETTIEEKHHQIGLVADSHYIGPVRVSLAMRLPRFESHLLKGHVDIRDVLDVFDGLRNMKQAVNVANFTGHPFFRTVSKMSQQRIRERLGRALYRCDVDGIFLDTSKTKKLDAGRKAAMRQRHKKLAGIAVRKDYHGLKAGLMGKHFRATAKADMFYTMKRSQICAEPLGDACATPAVKRRKTQAESTTISADAELLDQETVAFKVVPIDIGKKKRVQVPVGAGGSIGDRIPITVHPFLVPEDRTVGTATVSSEAATTAVSPDPVLLFDPKDTSMDELSEHMLGYVHNTMHWRFRDEEPAIAAVSHLATGMMRACAYQDATGSFSAQGYIASEADRPSMLQLSAAGFAVASNDISEDPTWYLTPAGRQQIVSAFWCEHPVRVFAVREHLPLEDRTHYELVCSLESQGWTWRPWPPPAVRRKMRSPPPIAYEPGAARVWFSTPAEIHASYLVALNRVDELFGAGLPCLPHGRQEKEYKDILQGNFGCALAIENATDEEPLPICFEGLEVGEADQAVDDDPDLDHASEDENLPVGLEEALAELLDSAVAEPLEPPPAPVPPPAPPTVPEAPYIIYNIYNI